MDFTMALTGNPNVGKTSLFNRITHSAEHVGNWHGVTVKDITKSILYDHNRISITDLPGLYSLTVYSKEEEVSRDRILYSNYDAVICICEVNNLSRNLYLALQVLELDKPLIIVINMMDELKKQGRVLNYRKIEQVLKVPIVPMSARYHSDVHLLMDVVGDYVRQKQKNSVNLRYLEQLPICEYIDIMGAAAEAAGFPPKWAAIKLMEKDAFVTEKLALSTAQADVLKRFGDLQPEVARVRYEFIDEITHGAISKNIVVEHLEMHEHNEHQVPIEHCISPSGEMNRMEGDLNESARAESIQKHKRLHDKRVSDGKKYVHGFSKIDRIVLNKYFALPIFFLVMAAIFYITFGLCGYWLSYLLELGIENGIYQPISTWLTAIRCPDWVTALLCDGVIKGIGGILVFLPQVVLLFFFLALLEDSGYLSRVAFMTDGLFRKIGLSGRSAFTMLMGFGCSATAVLTARGLEDEMTRKKTILLTPFMSCSARLPIYAVIAGAFFSGGAPLVIFSMYALGIVVSIVLAFILEKIKKFKSGKLSFIMEMPPYRLPTFERMFQIIWNNVKVFLVRIGTTIFALNVMVWLLANFSVTHGFVVGTDYPGILQSIAGFAAPIFAPLGFGNWRAVAALLGGIAAKEVVISSIESFGGTEMVFVGEYAELAALSFLIFTLLYIPCIATMVSVRKEAGIKWMFASLGLTVGVAYIGALVFYWIARLFVFAPGIVVGVLISVLILSAAAILIYRMVKKKNACPYGCENCSASSASCKKTKDDKK